MALGAVLAGSCVPLGYPLVLIEDAETSRDASGEVTAQDARSPDLSAGDTPAPDSAVDVPAPDGPREAGAPDLTAADALADAGPKDAGSPDVIARDASADVGLPAVD